MDALPEEGKVVVFECVPEQYRKVKKWLTDKAEKLKNVKLYRIQIPCSRKGDVYDWGEYIRQYGRWNDQEPFTGLFECWPVNYKFQVVPLDPEVLTDYNEDDIILPDFFSGLSEIQCKLLQGGRIPELIEKVSAELHVAKDIVASQMRDLYRGNCPPMERRGDMLISKRDVLKYKFPYYLVNGPLPYPVQAIGNILLNHLVDDSPLDLTGLMPECPPYVFKRHAITNEIYSVGYTESIPSRVPKSTNNDDGYKRVIFPYAKEDPSGDDLIVDFEAIDGSVYGEWQIPRTHFISTKWKFLMRCKTQTEMVREWDEAADEGAYEEINRRYVYRRGSANIVEVNSPQEYLTMWVTEITFNMAMMRYPDSLKLQHQQAFLGTLYMSDRMKNTSLRKFFDENEEAKIERIKRDYGGYEEFLDLPIRLVGPELHQQYSGELNTEYASRDVLLRDVKDILATYASSNKKWVPKHT